MSQAEVERKLDQIAAILKLAHRDKLDGVREIIRNEPAKAALLDATSDWTSAGDLVKRVSGKAKRSQRSVQVYIGELLALGLLEKKGAGRSTEYRSTGVI